MAFTQTPDIVLDWLMSRIKPSSFLIVMVVVRKTFGFQKKADQISLTQFQKMTGLSRQGVVEGIVALGPILNIKTSAKGTREPNEFSLNLDFLNQLVNSVDQSTNLTSQLYPISTSQLSRHTTYNNNKPIADSHQPASKATKQTNPEIKQFIDWWC